MAEWLRMLIFSALNHSSSQPCGFKPSSGHVRQTKFCLQVFFLGDLPFLPHLTIDSAQNEWNNFDGQLNPNKMKKLKWGAELQMLLTSSGSLESIMKGWSISPRHITRVLLTGSCFSLVSSPTDLTVILSMISGTQFSAHLIVLHEES